MLKPIFTEKSLRLAKLGAYTFGVGRGLNKKQIAAEIAKLFGVHVTSVRTIKVTGERGRNAKGIKFNKISGKKAIVTLKDKEKIDLFEESKK